MSSLAPATILDGFKARPPDASVLAAVIGDTDAVRVLAAWPQVRHTWNHPGGPEPDEPYDHWAWLWHGHTTNMEDLSRASGVMSHRIEFVVRRLHLLRLVYPDGTVPPVSTLICVGYVKQQIPRNRRQPPRRPARGKPTPAGGGR